MVATKPGIGTTEEVRRGGRPPAGTDPQKREQIMEGAGRVFSTLGFDAASMGDVAREAKVSKATLYVYFEDKEHLFSAICAGRRDRSIAELIALLDKDRPLDQVLYEFCAETQRRLSQPFVVSAHRIVIGVVARMPDVGREFYEAGADRLANEVAGFLSHHVAQGRLVIDNTKLAAMQLLELAQATIFRPRMFGLVSEPATEEEIHPVVTSAVRMFLAAYGVGGKGDNGGQPSP